MRISWTKSTLGALAAISLGLSLATPASAQYYRGGGDWVGPAVGLGVLGGVAAGAAIAGSQGGYYRDAGECWVERRPIYNEYGEFVGRRRMRVCN